MEPITGKPSVLRNILARALLVGVCVIVVRFAYVVTITGESCNLGDFCFFSLPQNLNFIIPRAGAGASAVVGNDVLPRSHRRRDLYSSKDWVKAVHFYSSIFQDLISEGYLSPHSKSLCVETPFGQDVFALKDIGVEDSIGIFEKADKPLVIKGEGHPIPFDDNTFEFIFSGGGHSQLLGKKKKKALIISYTSDPAIIVHASILYSFYSGLDAIFLGSAKAPSLDVGYSNN